MRCWLFFFLNIYNCIFLHTVDLFRLSLCYTIENYNAYCVYYTVRFKILHVFYINKASSRGGIMFLCRLRKRKPRCLILWWKLYGVLNNLLPKSYQNVTYYHRLTLSYVRYYCQDENRCIRVEEIISVDMQTRVYFLFRCNSDIVRWTYVRYFWIINDVLIVDRFFSWLAYTMSKLSFSSALIIRYPLIMESSKSKNYVLVLARTSWKYSHYNVELQKA